jgi:PTS system ascorbate-specific IIB component
MKEKINVLFVCGNGVGSSAMAEIIVSKSLKDLKISADVKHTSVGELGSMKEWCDIIIISKMLVRGIEDQLTEKPVIEVVNILDGKGIASKVMDVVLDKFPDAIIK